MAGRIEINKERCKGCGLCLTACPRGCIFISQMSNKMGYFPADTSNEDCSGCAMCALVCPEACIKVYRDSHRSKTKNAEAEHKKENRAEEKVKRSKEKV